MEDKRISVKALVLGIVTDLVGSLIAGVIVGVVAAIALHGGAHKEIAARLRELPFLISSLILGFGFTALGGFVAGRVAKRSEMLHGGIVGGVQLLIGILIASPSFPAWYLIVSLAGVIPAGMLGGKIAHATRRDQ